MLSIWRACAGVVIIGMIGKRDIIRCQASPKPVTSGAAGDAGRSEAIFASKRQQVCRDPCDDVALLLWNLPASPHGAFRAVDLRITSLAASVL
ncbi:hypothetical protein KCP69_11815 [Salmonella enterica subsp. enterica]|nr:hypothetical protein KCP69_11815 [Salmonella enterica subsp. enterica]